MFTLFYSKALYQKVLWHSQEVQSQEPQHLDSESVCERLRNFLGPKILPL